MRLINASKSHNKKNIYTVSQLDIYLSGIKIMRKVQTTSSRDNNYVDIHCILMQQLCKHPPSDSAKSDGSQSRHSSTVCSKTTTVRQFS